MKKKFFLISSISLMLPTFFSNESSMPNVLAEVKTYENEMNRYISSHTPNGWYKVGSAFNVSYQDEYGNYITERCQTITTNERIYRDQVIGSEEVTEEFIKELNEDKKDGKDKDENNTDKNNDKESNEDVVYSFKLGYNEVSSTSSIHGKYFDASGGLGGDISTPFFKVFSREFTLSYSRYSTRKETFAEKTSVAYTIATTTPGIWKLVLSRAFEQFRVMKFTKQERYTLQPVYDSKGNFVQNQRVLDHYEYVYSGETAFTSLADQYYKVIQ